MGVPPGRLKSSACASVDLSSEASCKIFVTGLPVDCTPVGLPCYRVVVSQQKQQQNSIILTSQSEQRFFSQTTRVQFQQQINPNHTVRFILHHSPPHAHATACPAQSTHCPANILPKSCGALWLDQVTLEIKASLSLYLATMVRLQTISSSLQRMRHLTGHASLQHQQHPFHWEKQLQSRETDCEAGKRALYCTTIEFPTDSGKG
eukprot:5338590-Amphidinium_carterae.1